MRGWIQCGSPEEGSVIFGRLEWKRPTCKRTKRCQCVRRERSLGAESELTLWRTAGRI